MVSYNTNRGPFSGIVVVENPKTVWIRLGNTIIKRHKRKHQVRGL